MAWSGLACLGAAVLALARQITPNAGSALPRLNDLGRAYPGSQRATARKRQAIEESITLITSSAALSLFSRTISLSRLCRVAATAPIRSPLFYQASPKFEPGGAIFCDVAYRGWGVDLQPTLLSKRP